MTEELQRLIEEAQPLAAADHQHGAEQGAGGAAEPAEDDNNQQLEGEHKVEQSREMVVSREASRPPPIPSKKALVAKAQVLMRKVLTPWRSPHLHRRE